MPAPPVASWQADSTTERLQKHYGLAHLRARKRGLVVTVESGPKDDVVPHFRVRRDTVHLWLLEFPGHRGWERTPYRDTLDNLLELVITQFAWTVEPVHQNPPDTSDRKN